MRQKQLLLILVIIVPALLAQGPALSYLTDPDTKLSFASCYLYFDGGSRHRIPFLPVVNSKGAPCGTERYTKDVQLKAPIVFVGNGIVRQDVPDPYRGLDVEGKVVMFSYDFPDRVNAEVEKAVSMEERIQEAVKRGAAGVVLFSAREENPFPIYEEHDAERIPEIPIIAINKRSAALILASDYRKPDQLFKGWEFEGKFRPGVLISKLNLRLEGKFDMINTDNFTFAFQPGRIPREQAVELADVNEKSVVFLMELFRDTGARWKKTFTVYYRDYDAKVFYLHHWGSGMSGDAGVFMVYDGSAPDYGLAVHENAHTLIGQHWSGSTSFMTEGIGKYAEAMATDKSANHRRTLKELQEGKLFPLDEMATINIGSDPRTEIAYPAAGSFVQFLIDRYSLKTLKVVYEGEGQRSIGKTKEDPWIAAYGKPLSDLEREWLDFVKAQR
jgi:hypothetical protein